MDPEHASTAQEGAAGVEAMEISKADKADRSTLIPFMKTQEELLGFREYFANEKVTVHLDNTKIYFTTESGFKKDIEKSETSEMELKLLEEELTRLNAAGEELYLPYCISKENQEEEKAERSKEVFSKDKEFAEIESSNEIALSEYVMESKEMKNLMKSTPKITSIEKIKPHKVLFNRDFLNNTQKNNIFDIQNQNNDFLNSTEFEDKLKVMTKSYEEKLKEAERKSKEKMEEKLKEMNDLLKSTRAEYDGLVEYGNQTKTFMREKLNEVKIKDTRTSPLPNMSGRSTTEESESGRTQASGSAMVTTTKCFNCDEFGHLGRDYPRQGTNIKMCYECRQFVTHRAAQCPKRRGKGGNNYRGGIKRSNENQNNLNAKRGRFNNKRGRGNQNRNNRGGKQPNSNDQQDKTALNVNGTTE
ncbi:uncharacterized protein LOC143905687 isoform X1 [Temnothorax americanus]|uniref:uncharacterized protein LOC143905687 isoform X1 n=1 Tax=Temnothorax americanus TaxID=1964332 RepID=UPI004068CA6D